MDKNKKLFPQRLWELIHDEKYNFCLRWSPDGQRVYLNRNDFELHYLKAPNNQFHTQKAISFVRQMNMYGFRKVDDCYYENDNFKKNCPHLLKNMVRRHSSKGFFSSTNLSEQNHVHNQQQVTGNGMQQQPQYSNRHQRNQLDFQILYKPNQGAAVRNTAQYYRDDTSLVGNIGAALVDSKAASKSPLASTLYHRLTALNFSQTDTNESALQDQLTPSNIQASLIASMNASRTRDDNLDQSQRARFTTDRPQQPDNINALLSAQQSLAAGQALQQTFIRSMPQLRQPQQPQSVKQDLISTIQLQHPNLFLDPMTNWNSVTDNNQFNQPMVSPLELVLNPASRLTSVLQINNQYQQLQQDNNPLLNLLVERSNYLVSSTSSGLDNVDDDDDDDELDDEECMIDFDEDMFNRNCSLLANGSSSSSSSLRIARGQHDFDDDDDDNVVLNLAKPSNTRSADLQKISKAANKV